jgi:hypothetical protein
MTTTMTRHDVPETVKNLLTVAQEALSLDVLDMYQLAANFGTDWKALTEELCLYAHASRHDGRGTNAKVVRAAEKVWAEIL